MERDLTPELKALKLERSETRPSENLQALVLTVLRTLTSSPSKRLLTLTLVNRQRGPSLLPKVETSMWHLVSMTTARDSILALKDLKSVRSATNPSLIQLVLDHIVLRQLIGAFDRGPQISILEPLLRVLNPLPKGVTLILPQASTTTVSRSAVMLKVLLSVRSVIKKFREPLDLVNTILRELIRLPSQDLLT